MHGQGAMDFTLVGHQNIMVTQYQPRAMSFILTWQNFITLISHCLIYTTCTIHIGYTPHTLYTSCTIHYMHYTPHALYTTYTIHYMHYTVHALYTTSTIHHIHYTLCALYTICTIHHIHYTLHALYYTCTIYHMHYIPHALNTTCTIHHMHYTLHALFDQQYLPNMPQDSWQHHFPEMRCNDQQYFWEQLLYWALLQYMIRRFSLNRPHWADSVIESRCPSVCLFVCAIGCSFFRGLSLALRLNDQ